MLSDRSTANALLGLLSIKAMSGYDLRQFIPETIGYFWNESYGQIYPALREMAAAGLVTKKTERAKGRPDRHVYSLTEAGRDRLKAWLEVPVSTEVRRNELLLKLFFGAHARGGVNRAHVEAKLAAELAEMKTYATIAKQLRREMACDPQLPYWLITLNRGRLDGGAAVKWCRETLLELDRLEKVKSRKQAKSEDDDA